MTDHSETIIACFDQAAGQWRAWFDGVPQVAFGGLTAINAIRRLLKCVEAGAGTYTVDCEPALGPVLWDPPELFVPCPDCKGSGEYVGLQQVEVCRTCAGRTVVPS